MFQSAPVRARNSRYLAVKRSKRGFKHAAGHLVCFNGNRLFRRRCGDAGILHDAAFREHIGHLMAVPIRSGAAALFYVGYLGAVLYLASWPAVKAGNARRAILPAVVLGLASYGTYEFTSYAIIADWHIQMLISDTIWGGVLTGLSGWAGAAITLKLTQGRSAQA